MGVAEGRDILCPKNPWDVMGCQVATCFEAPGVSSGGSGVSIGGFRILRVVKVHGKAQKVGVSFLWLVNLPH